MKHALRKAVVLFAPLLCGHLPLPANADSWSAAYLKSVLLEAAPDQRTVRLGDMEVLVENVRAWRAALADEPTAQAAFDGSAPLWTGGRVYYTFDASVSAAKRRAFLDGAAEWALFANLQFIPRTVEANYMLVKETPGLGGGQSAVGMIGGQQIIQFGPNAWGRSTICHEIGHALGMVHEHQRSDRDLFVQVFTNNVTAGQMGNFVKLANSGNLGAYDFLSVMHYNTNSFSVSPATLNTLLPLPAYAAFARVMGARYDPVLSPSDRAGMATKYGPGPALSSVVTNTADTGPGTLRAALYYAFDHPGTTITFNIPVSDPGYSNSVFNLLLTDALPGLFHATTVNGASQPGNSNPNGPEIYLRGSLIFSYAHGLEFAGTNCAVRGLTIAGFPGSAVLLDGTNCSGNTVAGCYLGVNPAGTAAATNGNYPVQISGGASGNTIGGVTAADRNLISGSVYQGLAIRDAGTRSNTVLGNYIGLNASGTAPIPNTWAGIVIFGGAQFNRIGGFASGAFNVISGNGNQGISVSDPGTSGNAIDGNHLGLNAAGTAPIPNQWSAVDIFGGATGNRVGGLEPGVHNVISGNGNGGVNISGVGTDGNSVFGNLIGLNATGTAAVPNAWTGVAVFGGARSNAIGATGSGNTISGNGTQGVTLSGPGTRENVVAGNTIGVSPGGAALGNQSAGIIIYGGAQSNLIGGTVFSGRNLISANGSQGVVLTDLDTRGNVVAGNYIGVNDAGSAALPNAGAGVALYNGPDSNLIGGPAPGAGNVISGNGQQGVALANTTTLANAVQGNLIGLNAAGTAALPNTWSGVDINAARGTTVGGTAPGARNVISGNANYGVSLNSAASSTVVQGNTIGYNLAHTAALPNGFGGVIVFADGFGNQIGGVTPGAANLIAGNSAAGVRVDGAASTNNTIRGNSIFANTGPGITLSSTGNRSLAAPALSAATLSSSTIVTGTYSGAANTTFQLDFHADAAPAAGAEGRTYLASRNVTTSGAGTANFNFNLPALVPAGRVLTANATDPAGNSSAFSAGVTVSVVSTVNDTVPDAWRAQFFGGAGNSTNAQSCAACDPDQDGAGNRAEFFAGTNPTNAASVLRLTGLAPAAAGDVASFPSVNGIVYRFEANDTLTSSPWTVLAFQVTGTGGPLVLNDARAPLPSGRVYRVGVAW